MESTTLHFDNARAAGALYQNDERLLREMEQRLGVQVAAREGWIRIDGEKDNADRAAKVFTQLDEARRSGAAIGKQEFRFALQTAEDRVPNSRTHCLLAAQGAGHSQDAGTARLRPRHPRA